MDFGDDYEDLLLTDIARRVYYCGDCNVEMNEVSERDAYCSKCGKRGWNVLFRCPKCGEEIIKFRQDITAFPPCYSCS